MVDKDKLVQVGFETTMLEESMAQDNRFEEDHSLQQYPEMTLGTTTTETSTWGPPSPNFLHGGLGDPHGIHTRSEQIGFAKVI